MPVIGREGMQDRFRPKSTRRGREFKYRAEGGGTSAATARRAVEIAGGIHDQGTSRVGPIAAVPWEIVYHSSCWADAPMAIPSTVRARIATASNRVENILVRMSDSSFLGSQCYGVTMNTVPKPGLPPLFVVP